MTMGLTLILHIFSGKTGRKRSTQPLNQNPVKVSELFYSAMLYFSSDANIPGIIYLLHPETMPIGLTLDLPMYLQTSDITPGGIS